LIQYSVEIGKDCHRLAQLLHARPALEIETTLEQRPRPLESAISGGDLIQQFILVRCGGPPNDRGVRIYRIEGCHGADHRGDIATSSFRLAHRFQNPEDAQQPFASFVTGYGSQLLKTIHMIQR